MLAAETTGHKDTEKTPASRTLEDSRRTLAAQFENGESHHAFSEAYTEIMDQYFRQSHQNSEKGRLLFKKRRSFALLAVGGYGRKELDFHSDIISSSCLAQKYPLWQKNWLRSFFILCGI